MKLHDDVFIGTLLTVSALIVLIWVIPAQIPDSQDETVMPPSLMANLSMGTVLLLSVILVIKGLFCQADRDGSLLTMKNFKSFGFVCLSLAISGVLLQYAGFFFGGIIITGGYMIKMGERRLLTLLSIAGGAAGICYLAIRMVN